MSTTISLSRPVPGRAWGLAELVLRDGASWPNRMEICWRRGQTVPHEERE
jgi:hypothetical protein